MAFYRFDMRRCSLGNEQSTTEDTEDTEEMMNVAAISDATILKA